MHIKAEYGAQQANSIYQAVTAFMQNMALSYRETGRPISSVLVFASLEQQKLLADEAG